MAENAISEETESVDDRGIAVVGLSGRFPGASSAEALWRMLCRGEEGLTFFSAEDLRAAGVDAGLLDHPRYVRAKGVVDDADLFDAEFFGLTAREAEILDPQQRLFLEVAWEALEDAACDPQRAAGLISVYAGAGASTYLLSVLAQRPEVMRAVGMYQILLSNEKDYLATRTSYKLGLTGPSFAVQSACSTSLVAIHQACQALIAYECDVALAGGSTIVFPQIGGYLHQEGGILSPDGHCRPFDAEAGGTAPGSGVAAVVLKRLEDALEDGDAIYAVVRGSAVNNDGDRKIGFTAPSVAGQAEAISAALAMAEVEASEIGCVEAHGTATALGDPIEFEALRQCFHESLLGEDADEGEELPEEMRGFCALGSIKSNVGHLDTAAGAAGFIKLVLALHHGAIPPSLHFKSPNPGFDLAASPFFVNAELREWPRGAEPRLGAVSSFGIGGTNAHVIVEEAPSVEPVETSPRPAELLIVSARTETALENSSQRLAAALVAEDAPSLSDAAATLQLGRRAFPQRRALVASSAADASRILAGEDPEKLLEGVHQEGRRPVVFLFPGQGAQSIGMAAELDRHEPVFREALDECVEILRPHLGRDLREMLYPGGDPAAAAAELTRTENAQPALFAVEWSLARCWAHWGVEPAAMLGHSIGEWTAAAVAGVLSLEDALALVAARGRLMGSLPTGSMLAAVAAEDEIAALLGDDLDLAAINAADSCVVSGPTPRVEALQAALTERGVRCRMLQTSHAFHSSMVDPILQEWEETVRAVDLSAPEIPFISNVAGDWISDDEATDPKYWVRQLRGAVRFADGVAAAAAGHAGAAWLEVGPGRQLGNLARRSPDVRGGVVAASLPSAGRGEDAPGETLEAVGRLWLAGVEIDWDAFQEGRGARRARLPVYPFDRRRYWLDAPDAPSVSQADASPAQESAPRKKPAPGRDVEAISEIWREILGVDEVGLYDDFFELGGSSLLAVSLLARIEERLGVSLSIDVLTQRATVAGLSAAIAATRGADSGSLLVTLASGDAATEPKEPIVLVHPIGGQVLSYLPLARALDRRFGGSRPILALRAPGLEDGETPQRKISALAELYCDILREHETPALLAGWSFGGLVAHAMVEKWRADGVPVPRLALIDSHPPVSMPAAEEISQQRRLAWFFQDFAGADAVAAQAAADSAAGEALEDLDFDRLAGRAAEAGLIPEGEIGRRRLERLYKVFEAHVEALADYRPDGSDAEMTLVLAAAGEEDGERVWRDLGARLESVLRVEGNHYSILRPPQVGEIVDLFSAVQQTE